MPNFCYDEDVIDAALSGRPVLFPLHEAKQQLVREAIAHAALDLFAAKSFEGATVDEIAHAAGVSRRSFFRYFASKNDLMAQMMIGYGHALAEAIAAAPRAYSPIEVVRDAVLRISALVAEYPRTRQIIRIVEASAAAREAQTSRRGEVEDRVAAAFGARLGVPPAGPMPALLASLILSIMDVTLKLWSSQPQADVVGIADQVMANLTSLVGARAPRLRQKQRGARRR